MDKYLDKLIIFILCAVFFLQYRSDIYLIVPVIGAVIISALMSYTDDGRIIAALALVFLVLCVVSPVFLFFLPVVCYDVLYTRYRWSLLLAVIPAGIGFQTLLPSSCVFIGLICVLAALVRRRTRMLEKLRGEYIALRDSTKEFSLLLENKNKDLMEKQDYEINLATLNERNRIARDIHDSIGHLLSSAILQTGAMTATCTDEVTPNACRAPADADERHGGRQDEHSRPARRIRGPLYGNQAALRRVFFLRRLAGLRHGQQP
jgi:signal transduction histidine kinase